MGQNRCCSGSQTTYAECCKNGRVWQTYPQNPPTPKTIYPLLFPRSIARGCQRPGTSSVRGGAPSEWAPARDARSAAAAAAVATQTAQYRDGGRPILNAAQLSDPWWSQRLGRPIQRSHQPGLLPTQPQQQQRHQQHHCQQQQRQQQQLQRQQQQQQFHCRHHQRSSGGPRCWRHQPSHAAGGEKTRPPTETRWETAAAPPSRAIYRPGFFLPIWQPVGFVWLQRWVATPVTPPRYATQVVPHLMALYR